MVGALAAITASAIVPDQLLPYVLAVSGLESRPCGPAVLHHGGGQGVLVCYPPGSPRDAGQLDDAVSEALSMKGLSHITVQAAMRPSLAPDDAQVSTDYFWSLTLPAPPPGQKLRNMLRSAAAKVRVEQSSGPGCFGPEHAAMVEDFCADKAGALDPGSAYIFRHIADYLTNAPDAALFSARLSDGVLAGCAVGDFSSLATAFYMFAFRSRKAPPGTADALLAAIAGEAARRGHARLNLGLGIGPGVEFFKKKWGAEKYLPCVETSWSVQAAKPARGWLARMFGR